MFALVMLHLPATPDPRVSAFTLDKIPYFLFYHIIDIILTENLLRSQILELYVDDTENHMQANKSWQSHGVASFSVVE